jgi:hypothetical protein
MKLKQESPVPLGMVTDLFEQLNTHGIEYCHWKSNPGLPQSLAGLTDLDLLISRDGAGRFRTLLFQNNFKGVVSHPSLQYPAVEDYLGFDATTGTMVHLHVHYRMILGEQHVKNYCLPLEKAFLTNVEMQHGVKVPTPALEISVLVLRALIKCRNRDLLKELLGERPGRAISTGIRFEIEDLLEKISLDDIAATLRQNIDFVPIKLVLGVLGVLQEPNGAAWALYKLRREARRTLAPYRRYGPLRARLVYYRGLLTRERPFRVVFKKLFPWRGFKKRPASGGLSLAFVGPDGSGKSTILEQLQPWLARRFNVCTYYGGSARPSFRTRWFRSASKLFKRIHRNCTRIFGDRILLFRVTRASKFLFDCLRFIAEGRDRYGRYKAGTRKAGQGWIVLYDRYPLPAIRIGDRYVDGPRIASMCGDSAGRVARLLSRIEESIYKQIRPPEHVFVLRVSLKQAYRRKPDHRPEALELKCSAFDNFKPDEFAHSDVNTEHGFERTMLEVKTIIWNLL